MRQTGCQGGLIVSEEAKADLTGPVLGADPKMAERFRLMEEADQKRQKRMTAQADSVAASVTVKPPDG